MIVCEKINKTYHMGDNFLHVLKDVSFKIDDGEFLAIIGPSGSGKSTIMNMLGALDRPDNGKYEFNGKNMLTLSDFDLAEIRAKEIGFVFQSFNLLSRTTVLRNVGLPLLYDNRIKASDRQKYIEDALRASGLEESRWHHKSNQLSGGQMQRVAIARALVNNPNLILADEPTGNLDSHTGEIILSTFQKLNREKGHTIVLITHDMSIAEHSDRVIQIKDGEIISDKKLKK